VENGFKWQKKTPRQARSGILIGGLLGCIPGNAGLKEKGSLVDDGIESECLIADWFKKVDLGSIQVYFSLNVFDAPLS